MRSKFSLSIVIALLLTLTVATAVWADELLTDGDALVPVVDTPSLDLGEVCAGTTVQKDVLHALVRTTNGNPNIFKSGTTVTVSVQSVSGAGLSASGGGLIHLPDNWHTLPQQSTLSDPVTSTITFVAGAPGTTLNGTVTYLAEGISMQQDRAMTRTDTLNVTARVVSCDTTPPVLHLPANMTVEATGPDGAVVTFTATADDADPEHPAVSCSPASGSTFPLGTTPVTCAATDAAGNTATGSFSVTVVDTTPPEITTPTEITVGEVTADGAVVEYSGQSAVDLVDGPVPVSCEPESGSRFDLGENTVTCQAADSRGNSATKTFTITVKDTTGPVLALPGNITAEATGPNGAVVTFTASASDNVDGELTPACSPASGSTFALGPTPVTCAATDSSGNTTTGFFVVTVQDTTPPVLNLPAGLTVEATGPDGAVVAFTATAEDLVDGVVEVTCSPPSGSTLGLGTHTISCSAADTRGNTANGSFSVTVQDTTPPELHLPGDQELEATGPDGAAAIFTVSATDLVDPDVEISCDHQSGDTFPIGTTTVTCTATDDSGNTAMGSFVIIVEDTTPPEITYLGRSPEPNENGWNNTDVTATWQCVDIVDGTYTVSETVTTEGENQSVTGYCVDAAGNQSEGNQVSGINIDKTRPIASASRSPEANKHGWNNTDVTVTFSGEDVLSGVDYCDAPVTLSGEGAGQSASGTCTDKAGNVSEPAVVTDINIDKTAPTISAAVTPERPATGWWNQASGAPTVTYTCFDATSGVVECPQSYTFPEGENQSHGAAVFDYAGNSASASVTDIDVDLTAPTLTWIGGPADGSSHYYGSVPAEPTCTAEDALSGPAGCSVSGYSTLVGQHTLTAAALDNAGNSTTEYRSYSVLAWTLTGFYKPVDMDGVYNSVKGGSTVPLKFQVFAGPTELTDVSAIRSLTYASTSCAAAAATDEIETLATGGTVLRYADGQFIFNWKTPKTAGSCLRVTLTTQDGSALVAYFKLK